MGRNKKKISVEEAEEFLMETDPILLETDPKLKNKVKLGTTVVVTLPSFSRRLKAIQKEQFDKKLVSKYGQIVLEDGKVLDIDKSYTIPLTIQIKNMLKNGVLMGGSKV